MRNDRRFAISASLLAMMTAGVSAPASAATCNWNTASGIWNSLTNWSCGAVPSGSDVVTINTAGGAVSLTGAAGQASTLTLGLANTLTVANTDLIITGGTLTNNGTMTFGANTRFRASGTLNIGGTGTIILDNSGGYSRIGEFGGNFIFGAGQTLRGRGEVGFNSASFTNNGLISADVTGATLAIDPAGGNGSTNFVNNSVLQATNGATLFFGSGGYDNNAGAIRAISNGIVTIGDDARIIGGTLTSNTGGSITTASGTSYLQNVTLSSGSNLKMGGSSDILINGVLTLNGTLATTAANRIRAEASGAVTINGTGDILLDNSSNFSRLGEFGGNFTLGSGLTVHGRGEVGFNSASFTNNGLISADVTGATLAIDPAGGNGSTNFVNNSVLQATNGATLFFGSGGYDNNAGAIRAISNGIVTIGDDARIIGGTLTSNTGGSITTASGTSYLQNVTLSSGSNLKMGGSSDILINGVLTLNGTLATTAANRIRAEASGAVTINGTGDILLDNSSNFSRLGEFGGNFTLGSGLTVHGAGEVGAFSAVITNNGLISADAGTGIYIDVSGGSGGTASGVGTGGISGLLNTGTIQAVNGKTLSFGGGRYENNAGIIRATNSGIVTIGDDARIIGGTLTSNTGGGLTTASGTTSYLQNVTLSSGSNLKMGGGSDILINGVLTLNGTLATTAANRIRAEASGAVTINGTGDILLDNSSNFSRLGEFGGNFTLGSGLTVHGAGEVGAFSAVITNNGLISADAGTGIYIDVSGGSGGTASGVGTGGISGLLNTGTIQAVNGKTLSFGGGRYENSATGTLGTLGAGSIVTMNDDASLFNLQGGGVLNKGVYISSTAGAASRLDLRSNGANSIVTIGTGAAGTDTIVTLSGANSVLDVLNFGTGAATTIDASLTGVASSGRFEVLGGRNFTVVAGGGAFSNAGIVQLGGGTFGGASYTNSGQTFGFGTIGVPIANTGTVRASGGTLSTGTITGSGGTVRSDVGATLNLAGAAGNSTAGFLANNGSLALGTRNFTVTSDYTNANFGAGNAFNGRANVTGSGMILAASATMDLSAPGLVGNVLSVGNVRVGGSTTTQLTVMNNGLQTTLRGAVQNVNAPGVSLSQPDFVVGPNGGSAIVTIGFSGNTAGSLAGQSLDVKNNFDNVAARTLTLNGNVYQIAVAGAQPATITLGAQRVGGAPSTAAIVIKNTAPDTNGFTEKLSATATSGGSGFLVNGAASATTADLSFGATQAVSLSHGTGTSGSFSNTVTIANTSIAVPASGLGNLALATQSIAVKANVYQAAVASVGASSVDFGPVRQGAASPLRNVSVTNGASGALTDALVTTITGQSGGVSGSAPASLGAGATGNAVFSLDTSVARVVSGAATLNFTSHDAELADLGVGSQSLSFAGTVTQTAIAQLFKNAGVGTLTGNGTSYNLDLGSFSFGSGSVSSDIGVNNAILASAFAESLGGSFSGGTGNGYSFSGAPFANVQGGSSDTGNLLTFNYTGLNAGTYTNTVTFNGFSRFAGLADLSLSPIALNIRAQVTGGAAAVPEPAIWLQMIMGFMIVGGTVRARRTSYKLQANR